MAIAEALQDLISRRLWIQLCLLIKMLKTVIKSASGSVLLGVLLCLPAAPASAEVFYTVRDLLAAQFKASQRVTFVQIRPNAGQQQRIEARLGRALPKREYTFYVATSDGRVDGYALFDEERGQHELISFATFFDASGQVTRVEVVAYREPYGDGIRAERFRKQFVGRGAQSGFAPDRDIDAISGATISSRSMCLGVQRAALLLKEALLESGTQLAAR
jgi:Na+-translocating ferredoxin:NAD+ oxidoreductase subunit G